MAEVVHRTAEELQAEIAGILREFPALNAYDPSGSCCAGCVHSEVGRDHGWDAADAWERLQDLRFLLGRPE